MKKILALVLALAVVCSFGITAFAAGSPVAPIYTEKTTSELPVPEIFGLDICKLVDDGLVSTLEDVKIISVGKADELSDEDKAAFLEAYEAVKEIKDKIVVYFFWLDLGEGVEVGEENYAKFSFTCPGKNVEVTVNGKAMEVTPDAEKENAYIAKLTEVGAIAVLCDAK